MTEMQAAIGRIQLRKLAEWVKLRRRNAAVLGRRLSALPALRVPVPSNGVYHSYYKFYAFVRPEALKTGWDRDRIMNAVAEKGAPCFSGSCSEIYLEKAFSNGCLRQGQRLPTARQLGETSLMFLVHPTLTPEDMKQTAAAVERVMARASQ